MIGTSGVIQLDDDVVDAEADQRRQQVLDRFHRSAARASTVAYWMPPTFADGGGNLEAAEVGAAETDAGVGGGGLERQRDLLAGVKTDAGARDLTV